MKKLLLLILLTSCMKLEKPWIIYSKGVFDDGQCRYYYQDIYGKQGEFTEYIYKYNIGDTIK